MLRLHQFPPNSRTRNLSPFCLKLETYLRLADIAFEAVSETNPGKGPKGKMPFIDDEGQRIGDSHFIIAHLKEKHGDKLDAKLSAADKALGVAITRLFESDFYFALVYFRWYDEAGWAFTRERVFGKIPLPLRWLVCKLAHRRVANKVNWQGVGRHSREEVARIGREDLDAISQLLGDQDFFLGSKVSSVDATAYGFLKNLVDDPQLDSPLVQHAKTHRNLVAYVARMDALVFGEGRVVAPKKLPKKTTTRKRA